MRRRKFSDINVSSLAKYSMLEKIKNQEITKDDLLSRANKDAIRTTFLINKHLYQALQEAVMLLREHGVKVRSVNELIHLIAISFLETLARTEIPEPSRELVIAPTIVFNQTPIIRKPCNTLRHTLHHVLHSDDKYYEVKSILRKAEVLRDAIANAKDDKKKLLLKAKLEELIGLILERLSGDDSIQAERYKKLAKSILRGIQAYFER